MMTIPRFFLENVSYGIATDRDQLRNDVLTMVTTPARSGLKNEIIAPREKCPYLQLFWFAFFRIRTEYGEILRISPYSVQMRENTVQNNSEYWVFSGPYFSVFGLNTESPNSDQQIIPSIKVSRLERGGFNTRNADWFPMSSECLRNWTTAKRFEV